MKKNKIIGALIAFCFWCSPIFSQSIYYVDAAMADNSGNGTSWATAKKDVQDAIDASSAGDQIWVKKGVYKPKNYPATMYPVADSYPAGSPVLPLTDRDNMFFLKNNQKIYGGFAGTETNINQRTAILGSNKTTFSGDVGTVGDSTDNCYHILVYLAPDAGAVAPTIDGIHFVGANANSFYGQAIIPGAAFGSAYDFGVGKSYGGAVFIYLGTNGQINNCSFARNYSANRGSGVWFDGGFGTSRKINITRSFFYENRSSSGSYGAAISFNCGENTVANNVFYKNTAGQGAAIFQTLGEAKIYSNTFVKNEALIYGVVSCYQNGDSALFYNNLFYQNISGNLAGYTNSYGADFDFPGTYYTTPNPDFGGVNLGHTWDNLAKNNLLELTAADHNNTFSPYVMNNLGTGSVGNIYQQNPDFQNINDLDGLDNILGTADDGLIPGAIAGVVDAGDSTLALSATGNFDISNYDRIEGGNINMGAYERTWAPCVVNATFTITSCGPFTWINGNTFTTSNNTATHTLVGGAVNGCDSIITLNLTIPTIGTPDNISTTNITETAADVTWDAMTLPVGGFFTIQYRAFGSGTWISAGTAAAGSTSAAISGLNPGTLYEVQVAGNCDGSNAGAWSGSGFFTTDALTCSAPIVMSPSANLGNAITMSWSNTPLAAWFEFRYKVTGSSTWTFAGTLGGAATSKIFSGLIPATSYDFESRSFCPNGTAGAWSSVTATTIALAGCALAPNLAQSNVTGTSTTLTWSTLSGAGWYEFRYKPTSSSTWIAGGTAGPSATSKSFYGLSANTAYVFEARTFCTNGVASSWGPLNVTTSALAGCELPPVLNSTANVTTNSVQISWPTVNGAAWYSFQYKLSSSSIWLNGGTAGPSATTKTYNGLLVGMSYDFQARTHCSTGIASAWSGTGSYSTSGGATTLVLNNSNKVDAVEDKNLNVSTHVPTVYPNPASNEVNVDIFMEVENGSTRVKLMDMSGRIVRELTTTTSLGTNTLTLDIEELSNGMYSLLVYQNDNLMYTAKVKKN